MAGVSDEAVLKATGKNWAAWERIISDAEEGAWSHREIASFLHEKQGVGFWWSQTIATTYEQRRGRRRIGETASGFQIGVRKTYPLAREELWGLLVSPEGLSLWLGTAESLAIEAGSVFQTENGVTGEIRVVKSNSHIRLTWKPEEWDRYSTLQVRVIEAASGRATLSFHQENLPDQDAREKMREHWKRIAESMMDLM
jgi:uncharacterized protein YndB with AHSA1/START domain